jgi:hypothetical protein
MPLAARRHRWRRPASAATQALNAPTVVDALVLIEFEKNLHEQLTAGCVVILGNCLRDALAGKIVSGLLSEGLSAE